MAISNDKTDGVKHNGTLVGDMSANELVTILEKNSDRTSEITADRTVEKLEHRVTELKQEYTTKAGQGAFRILGRAAGASIVAAIGAAVGWLVHKWLGSK